MRLIRNPNQLPGGATPPPGPFTHVYRCSVIPNRTEDRDGFIQTDNHCMCGEEVLVSVAAAREMGRLIGLVPEVEVNALKEEVQRLAQKLEEWELDASAFNQLSEVLEEVN